MRNNLKTWGLFDSKFTHILFFSLSAFLLSACGGNEASSEENSIAHDGNQNNDRITQSYEISDPLYDKQWYLHKQSGINISSVWKEYLGEGISIAVVDSGIEALHPDLEENVDLIHSFRYSDESSDPTPTKEEFLDPFVDAPHGTAVAGIIAASQNDIGISGVAPKANLIGLNVFSRPDDSAFENAMLYPNVDISSNSWGADLSFGLDDDRIVLDAIVSKMINNPIIYTFAAGNETSNSGFSSILNSRYTLVIGATTVEKKIAPYSNYGANILCVAPGGAEDKDLPKIITTDLIGDVHGYDIQGDHFDIFENQDYEYSNNFNGTSAAVPMVSGVIALMLEANKALTYRDIKYILAHNSQKIDTNHTSWVENSAELWVSRYYGFGLIDALDAVKSAKIFQPLPKEIMIQKSLEDLNISIADNDEKGVTLMLDIDDDFLIEYAKLEINSNHPYSGDLKITLTSPSGTNAVLADGGTITEDLYAPWAFGAIGFMDEKSSGNWRLHISDISENDTGVLSSVKLILYGHQE
jgi:subtilisin family serine protease